MVPKRELEESLRLFPRSKWNRVTKRVCETFLYCLFPTEAKEIQKEVIYWGKAMSLMWFVSITRELGMTGRYIQFVPCLLSTWCRFLMFLLWTRRLESKFTMSSILVLRRFWPVMNRRSFSLAIWRWALDINFSL